MLKLLTHPNEFLEKKLPDFDFDHPIMDPKILEEEMIKLMAFENGIGLSASQVGVEARVFTMITRNLKEVKHPFAVFNPQVIAVSEDIVSDQEGCLSFPGLLFYVKRPEKILVEFLDRDKNKLTITLEGIDARCFLHELDHLDGICFTDRISKFKLDRAREQQRKRNGRAK